MQPQQNQRLCGLGKVSPLLRLQVGVSSHLNIQHFTRKTMSNQTMKKMKKLFLVLVIALIAGCNTNKKVESTSEHEFPSKGNINWEDTINLSKIPDSAIISVLADKSIVYLRQDNYCPDQFYCVVETYCYYRLTNIHPQRTISGNVHKVP